ncbi:predicted protein [Lichtheimia corymbifera JMRC:FSU:9682]|uniref:SCP domain-containing protein n=1 Tax=Lichtheimia corymbifera JMRC:FSU:9682 TaxID=1263082 RepID=A0A068RM77_9FUNG|nr:predicted protein [Lichtheimia corymbifera JMRC:FSU:9682]
MLPNLVQFLVVVSSALIPVVWTLPLLNLDKLLGTKLLKTNGALPTNPEEVLATHNHFREIHGSPPLTWDDNLATYALQWSTECVLKHSGGPYGENIAKGPTTWKESITDWYNEQSQYDFSNPVSIIVCV